MAELENSHYSAMLFPFKLTRERNAGNPVWQFQYQISKIIQDEEEKKPNPVTQRVKVIMVGIICRL